MTDCDLLLWKRPAETAKVFVALLSSLLILKKVNLITFFLRVFYSILFVNSTIEFISRLALGQGLISKYGARELPNVANFLTPKIDQLLKRLPADQTQARNILFAASPQQSFKAAGCLYVLHKLFSVFSLWTLTFISVIATFTVPFIYKTYQKEIDSSIDHGLNIAKQKSLELQKLACEKATPFVKELEGKLGPLGHYLKSYNNRGASTTAPSGSSPVVSDTADTEEPSVGATSSASFPTVPSGKIGESIQEETTEDLDVEKLKQELKDNKAAVGI